MQNLSTRTVAIYPSPQTSIEAVCLARLNLGDLFPAGQNFVEYCNHRAFRFALHSLAARIMATTTLRRFSTLVELAHTYAVQ